MYPRDAYAGATEAEIAEFSGQPNGRRLNSRAVCDHTGITDAT
jgi:hypothetical protein